MSAGDEQSTPPGYNKRRRDVAKFLLAATSVCLLTNQAMALAIIFSGVATVLLKPAKLSSAKNLKWIVLSAVSFVASLVSSAYLGGQALLDESKAYELKYYLLLRGRFIQTVWGGILALFIYSAFTTVDSPADAKQSDEIRKNE